MRQHGERRSMNAGQMPDAKQGDAGLTFMTVASPSTDPSKFRKDGVKTEEGSIWGCLTLLDRWGLEGLKVGEGAG